MTKITFQPVMDGIKRKLIINDKVAGYKHTEQYGIHFFSRGKISYMFDTNFEAVKIKKIDSSTDQFYQLHTRKLKSSYVLKFVQIYSK